MKTMAQFKRDAASGKMSLELFERFGSTDFPERLKGIRKVTKTNSVEITLTNKNGEDSTMGFGRASLMEYDDNTLFIYQPGYRELTKQENACLIEWRKIQSEYEERNPYGNSYWKMKDYFQNCPYPWLAGLETIHGKKLEYDKNCTPVIRDSAIKGECILKYHVYIDV